MLKIFSKQSIKYFLILVISLIFFSYRLTSTPQGITIDEAAFGYNAVLLSNTLHDENGRFLPAFVLSIDGKDWRQPVTQYAITVFFKIFGASVYNLKFTSVIVAAVSAVLAFLLGEKLLGRAGGIFCSLFFATTPIVMIHSHLGLDNIMPLPFVLLWLLTFFLFEKTKSVKYLIVSAFSLGIGFYSYKGMRSFVPIWTILSVLYLMWPLKLKISKSATIFIASIAPFYLIIPLLEYKYAGAVLGQTGLGLKSVYSFMHSYLASFDPSFLFITGDTMLHHSTGRHGMLLLASLPFFILGLGQVKNRGKYWIFITLAFFAGPLLFGFPGSVHRASRLMSYIPLYAIICALGAHWLYSKKQTKLFLAMLLVLLSINYYDFIYYYWYQYPQDNYHIFYQTDISEAYKELSKEAKEKNLTPLITQDIINGEVVVDNFARSIYFAKPFSTWQNDTLINKSVVLSRSPDIVPVKPKVVEVNSTKYYLYVLE